MNKPTFTALYGLLVILVFFGISASIQACGGKKKADAEIEEDLSSRAEALADTYSEDEIFEDDDESESASYSSDSDDSSPSSYTSNESDNTSYTSPPVSSSRSRSGAPHVVIAGNYLLEDNADKMINDLKRKGFTSAEKVVFDLSQYYTVIAGRYANRTEASRRAGELKRSGIDTYVITK